ncbi:MAG TPA: IS200/IS605 family transposase [Lentisphaeria bacterium]|nr:MAG: hypothetical protein A2X47_10975 [Lentisphaerae bacterium GWF2_38_69]HBM17578.1 IS200/IS605 family transposase [Lentisphaeria bacterium]
MGHTYSNLLVHIVFSTKERINFLYKGMRPELFSYICGIAKNIDCYISKIGGVEDHIHILVKIPPNISASDVVMKLKANSSKWIHEKYPTLHDFAWQPGFSCFSVSESAKANVQRYIELQEEHHKRIPLGHELKMFYEKNKIL